MKWGESAVSEDFARYLSGFAEHPKLRSRILTVLRALPHDVTEDFLVDPCFHVSLDNYQPGKGSTVWIAAPDDKASTSRSVVLKPRLNEGDEAFALYVIAHEFAHAFLRNGPWNDITDVEEAADALAAHWGFVCPPTSSWARFWKAATRDAR